MKTMMFRRVWDLVYTMNKYYNKIGFSVCEKYSKDLVCQANTFFEKSKKRFPSAQVAVAVYGSAARGEMSAESDADLLVFARKWGENEDNFRNHFVELFERCDKYPKIDIPRWRELRCFESLIGNSIPEGNQILEAIPVAGDDQLTKDFLLLQQTADSKERSLRNLIFQKNCFEDYYRKRRKRGFINVKYSRGGVRDLLFFIYVAKLYLISNYSDTSKVRTVVDAVKCLEEAGLFSNEDEDKLFSACSTMMLLRSECLRHNKGTPLSNLSFFNPRSESLFEFSSLLQSVFSDSATMLREVLKSQDLIAFYKGKAIDWVLRISLSPEIYNNIINLNSGNASVGDIKKFLGDPYLIVRIFAIWEVAKRSIFKEVQYELQSILCKKKYTWEEVASLLSIPEISGRDITGVVKKIIDIPEYGYILRIVAQHKNTPTAVLRDICLKRKDKRYTQLAEIALLGRRDETNFQI